MQAILTMTEPLKYHLSVAQIEDELDQVKAAQLDPGRFDPLYKKYYARIVNYVYHRIDSKEIAYEITSQVFYNALNNLAKFKSQGTPFGAWLFQIAGNELNQWFRKNKANRTINIDVAGIAHLKQEVDEKNCDADDQKLFEALQRLGKDDLELIDLRFFEDRPFKEIAEITKMNESACKMRIYRILEKLKHLMK